MTLVALIAVAVLAGLFGSMLGVGGGIIMVPMLSLAFGVPIKTAIATSIVCVIATSSMAQTVYVGRGMTHVKLGMFLEVATTAGAVAGGITAVLVSGRLLQYCFAAVLFYVAWQMNRRGADVVPSQTGTLPAVFYDNSEGREGELQRAAPVAGVRAEHRRRQPVWPARSRWWSVQGTDHEPARPRACRSRRPSPPATS